MDCNGDVMAMVRDDDGSCITRDGTAAETRAVTAAQSEIVDVILAGLDAALLAASSLKRMTW